MSLPSYHLYGILRCYLPVGSERWKPSSRRLLDFNYDRIPELLFLPIYVHFSFSVMSDNHLHSGPVTDSHRMVLTAIKWFELGLSVEINPEKWIWYDTVESSSFSLFLFFLFPKHLKQNNLLTNSQKMTKNPTTKSFKQFSDFCADFLGLL